MGQHARPGLKRDALILLVLLILALILFLDHASLELAPDDLAWLQGNPPFGTDRYRLIPLGTFFALVALFGPSAQAALAVMFTLHCLNTLLVFQLGRKLLEDRLAVLVAAAVFAINPITLSALTWVSCLSYVQGATLALAALLAFWKASDPHAGHPTLWAAVVLLCFGAGLFCSHTLFFVPVLFLVLGWFRSRIRLGAILLGVGMMLAAAINAFAYGFEQYGIEASGLLDGGFALAYASTGLSSGLALALAYPVSFFVPTVEFLQALFVEPLRWAMTVVLLGFGILANRTSRDWRISLVLALSFLTLIAPYVIRLYLTPDTVNFDVRYVLSGRVFYLPFVVVSLALGRIAARLFQPLQGRVWAWLFVLLPLAAYVHGLWAFDAADTPAWQVVLGDAQPAIPPRWNPYTNQQPVWMMLSVGILLLLAIGQLVAAKLRARPRPF